MRFFKIKYYVFFIAILICCKNENSKNSICKLEEVKTILSYDTPDSVSSYTHYVLFKGFYRECMDSAIIVTNAIKYMDSVSLAKPIGMLIIFNSTKNFIPHSISQYPEINKNRLVSIYINDKSQKPYRFSFFNKNGEMIYQGPNWRPKGDRELYNW